MTEVAECCSIDFSMVARHLSTMAKAGLLTSEKKGRTVWYTADGPGLAGHFRELADAIDELTPAESGRACCDPACCDPAECETDCCGDGPDSGKPETT